MFIKNENFSFLFFKKTFECIKTCIDKVTAPETGQMSADARLVNYRIYCACDLALGLVMSKTESYAAREGPQPSLHSKYYIRSKSPCENNNKCYLPESMQFAVPKRCVTESEVVGKTNKKIKRER